MKREIILVLLFLISGWVNALETPSVWLGVPAEMEMAMPDEAGLGIEIYGHRENAMTKELPRQALLIAARDELGAVTRDDMLFETAPVGAVKIDDVTKLVPFTLNENSSSSLFALLGPVEKFSRNEYVAELKKRGVKNSLPERPKNDDGAVPDKILISLRKMTLAAQYDAVRQIHRLIREKGESPDRLRALVRGYLQLQLLTNANFLDVHRVFQARAFLYQQRFKAKYGDKDPEVLRWDIAVRSLTHFFVAADLKRKDLAKMTGADKSQNTGSPLKGTKETSKNNNDKSSSFADQKSKGSDKSSRSSDENPKTSESKSKAVDSSAKTSESKSKVVDPSAKTSESKSKIVDSSAKTSESKSKAVDSSAKGSEEKSKWSDMSEFLFLADAYSRYDQKALIEKANRSEKELALLLRYCLNEFSTDWKDCSSLHQRKIVEEILVQIPECTRVGTGGFRSNTFDMLYLANRQPYWKVQARQLGPALQGMTDLPKEVFDRAGALDRDESGDLKTLGDLLINGGSKLLGAMGKKDSRSVPSLFSSENYLKQLDRLLETMKKSALAQNDLEPSLEGLATILRDDAFQTFYLIAEGNGGHNGTPENLYDPLSFFLKKHPLYFMFDLFQARDKERNERVLRTMKKNDYPLAKISQAAPQTDYIYYWNRKEENEVILVSPSYGAGKFACPDNLRDFRWILCWYSKKTGEKIKYDFNKTFMRFYQALPSSPLLAEGFLLYNTSTLPEKTLTDLEKKFADYPNVITELGAYFWRRADLDRWEQAILKGDLTRSKIYGLLDYYYKCDRIDDGLKLVERYLKTEDANQLLNSYHTKVQAAELLLKDKTRNDLLRQYAEEASRCHSCIGLEIMANALRRNGEFSQALEYFEQRESSYPESVRLSEKITRAYEFQTDDFKQRADEALLSKADFLLKYKKVKKLRNALTINDLLLASLLTDQALPEKFGEEPLLTLSRYYNHSVAGWIAFFDFVKRKDQKMATAVLDFLAMEPDALPQLPQLSLDWAAETTTDFFTFVPLARVIRKTLKEKREGKITDEEIKQLLDNVSSMDGEDSKRSTLLFFLGCYFDAYDQKERAHDFYKKSLLIVNDYQDRIGSRALALKRLRKDGFTQEDYQKLMFKGNDPFKRIKPIYGGLDKFLFGALPGFSKTPLKDAAGIKPEEKLSEPIPKTSDRRHWRVAGHYRLEKTFFRNKVYVRTADNIIWSINDDFCFSILNDRICFFQQTKRWRFCQGDFYLVDYSSVQLPEFLLGFYENRMFAQININIGKLPSHPDQDLNNETIRLEFVKIQPPGEKAAASGKTPVYPGKKNVSEKKDSTPSGFFLKLEDPTTLFIYCFAIFILVDLIIFIFLYRKILKKKRAKLEGMTGNELIERASQLEERVNYHNVMENQIGDGESQNEKMENQLIERDLSGEELANQTEKTGNPDGDNEHPDEN